MNFLIAFIISLSSLHIAACDKLENISDDELVHSITSNEFIVVLFGIFFYYFIENIINGRNFNSFIIFF